MASAWTIVTGKKGNGKDISAEVLRKLVTVINGIPLGTAKEEVGKRIGQVLRLIVSWSSMAKKFNLAKLIACLEALLSSFPGEVLSIATVAFMVDGGLHNIQPATREKLVKLGITHIGRVNTTPAPAPAPALAPASQQTKGAASANRELRYQRMLLAGPSGAATFKLVVRGSMRKVPFCAQYKMSPITDGITSNEVCNLIIAIAKIMAGHSDELRGDDTMGNSKLTCWDGSKEEIVKLFVRGEGGEVWPVCMGAIFDNREEICSGMSQAEVAKLAIVTELAAPNNSDECKLKHFCHNPLCDRIHNHEENMKVLLHSLSAVGCIRSLMASCCGKITSFPAFEGPPKVDNAGSKFYEVFDGQVYVLP